jgi:hypothetical protein
MFRMVGRQLIEILLTAGLNSLLAGLNSRRSILAAQLPNQDAGGHFDLCDRRFAATRCHEQEQPPPPPAKM